MSHAPPQTKARKRPVAVTLVSIITLLSAAIAILVVLLALGPGGLWEQARTEPLFVRLHLTETGQQFIRAIALLISGGVTFVLSLGLFGVRRWAWVGLMVWSGGNLAFNLIRYWYGRPEYAALLLGVTVVFALNLAEVQQAFGIRRQTDDTLAADD